MYNSFCTDNNIAFRAAIEVHLILVLRDISSDGEFTSQTQYYTIASPRVQDRSMLDTSYIEEGIVYPGLSLVVFTPILSVLSLTELVDPHAMKAYQDSNSSISKQ